MTCSVSAYQIISFLFGATGIIIFFILLRAVKRVILKVNDDRLIAIKSFMAGIFLMSVGQIYQGVISRALVPVWLKLPLIFIFISAIFAIKSLNRKRPD